MQVVRFDSEDMEALIVGTVISCLLNEGFRIEISDTDGGGTYLYAAENGGHKPRDGYKFWVRFTPGNGADVLMDYTTNLETIIKPANILAEKLQAL